MHETVDGRASERSSTSSRSCGRLGVVSVSHAQGIDVVAETHSGRGARERGRHRTPRPRRRRTPGRPRWSRPSCGAVAAAAVPAIVALLRARRGTRRRLPPRARGTRASAAHGTPKTSPPCVGSALKGEQHVVAALARRSRTPAGSGSRAGERPVERAEREVLVLPRPGPLQPGDRHDLSVTLATVKSHLVRIYAKLEASNRNEALGRAVALGPLAVAGPPLASLTRP